MEGFVEWARKRAKKQAALNPQPSLLATQTLEEATHAEGEARRSDNAEPLRQSLQRALDEFLDDSSAAALAQFGAKVSRALEAADWPDPMGRRQRLVGAYFEAALKGRRRAGRPAMTQWGLFEWINRKIDEERVAAGKAKNTQIPAKQISERCFQEGLGDYSADTIRKLMKARRAEAAINK